VRVATFNLHAGVDGWGRPTKVLDHVVSLNADVLILPELWRAESGADFVTELKTRLGMEGLFVPLASGQRVTSGSGGKTWQPPLAHFSGERGLFFDEHRTLSKGQRIRRATAEGVEYGEWGLGLLTRLPIREIHSESLGRLPREKVQRALIVSTLEDAGRPFHVLAVHGAHLSHGSYRQYRRVSEIVARLDPDVPILLGGDFNSWRPLLRVLLPGWRSLVNARTWPARTPHSQIDHLLVRGSWERLGGFASDGGSDHRALVADVRLAPQ
jgi:endonuclease/exonuclease/phosphatase family metal-dependent hydrolase